MKRIKPIAVAMLLGSACSAAFSDPFVIQPEQQFTLDSATDHAVAVHGTLILVGSPGGSVFPATTGVVYTLANTRGGNCHTECWVLKGQFQRPDALPNDQFGASLAFDGETLVVGSPALVPGSEAAFVYRRKGDHFVAQQTLKGVPLDPTPGGNSNFGITAVLSGDRLALTELPEFFSGAAYVFKRHGDGVWRREARLQPANVTLERQYGVSVDLDDDTLIVGADVTGYANIFKRRGDHWSEAQTLIAWDDQDVNGGGGFGRGVGVRNRQVAVGAYFSTNPAGVADGSVYVFKERNNVWGPEQKLERSDDDSYVFFGAAVLFRGNRIAAAGANGIYIFEHQGPRWVEIAKLVSPDGFSVVDSLDSMDWQGSTLVAAGDSGVSIFDLSNLDSVRH